MSLYKLIRPMGEGGMGTVFEAWRIFNGRPRRIACKSLRDDRLENSRYCELFGREVELNFEIGNEHPGLVTVYDCIEDKYGRHHLMMELVRGCNLFEIRQAFGRIRWDVLQLIATEVLNTLGYIHSRGVVHRDISPCNVLASLSGEIKVSDLGLAKFITRNCSSPPPGLRSPPWGPSMETPDHL